MNEEQEPKKKHKWLESLLAWGIGLGLVLAWLAALGVAYLR